MFYKSNELCQDEKCGYCSLNKAKTPNHKNVYQINLIAQVNFKFMPKYICMNFK